MENVSAKNTMRYLGGNEKDVVVWEDLNIKELQELYDEIAQEDYDEEWKYQFQRLELSEIRGIIREKKEKRNKLAS